MMKIYFQKKKQVFAEVDGFTIKSDQPVQGGGDNEYPNPFLSFLASLGNCAGTFAKGYCDARNIPTDKMYLTMDTRFDPEKKIMNQFDIKIHVPSDFPENQESGMIRSASLCAVKRHLRDDIAVDITIERE